MMINRHDKIIKKWLIYYINYDVTFIVIILISSDADNPLSELSVNYLVLWLSQILQRREKHIRTYTIFGKTSLSGRRMRFSIHPMCTESVWKANYKFPAPPVFSFSISAVRFRAYSTSWKNERRSKSRTMRVFASEYDSCRGPTNWKGRLIARRDCGWRLSRIKGIKGGWRRLPGEWRRISDLSTSPSILASFHARLSLRFSSDRTGSVYANM